MIHDIVDETFARWVKGKSELEARIAIYHNIRDIPYAVVPEINDPVRFKEILTLRKGSCTPKHFLLCAMYHKLGMDVLYAVYTFRWDEFVYIYPPELGRLAKAMPPRSHLACKVDIGGRYVLVDATVDPPLRKAGFPVTMSWDGVNDTLLPIGSHSSEHLYDPSEAILMQERVVDEQSLIFYTKLNSWLDSLRSQR